MVTLPEGQGPSVESNFSNMLGQILGTLYGSKVMQNPLGAALFGNHGDFSSILQYFQNPQYAKYPQFGPQQQGGLMGGVGTQQKGGV
jgi:hypothetical protein